MELSPKQIWQHGGVLIGQDILDHFYRLEMNPMVTSRDGWHRIEKTEPKADHPLGAGGDGEAVGVSVSDIVQEIGEEVAAAQADSQGDSTKDAVWFNVKCDDGNDVIDLIDETYNNVNHALDALRDYLPKHPNQPGKKFVTAYRYTNRDYPRVEALFDMWPDGSIVNWETQDGTRTSE